ETGARRRRAAPPYPRARILPGFRPRAAGYLRFESVASEGAPLTIAVIVAVCIVLAILAFLAPRASWWPQKGVDKTLGAGQDAAGKLPGKGGGPGEKPFETSRTAANTSASKGREGRSKMPT